VDPEVHVRRTAAGVAGVAVPGGVLAGLDPIADRAGTEDALEVRVVVEVAVVAAQYSPMPPSLLVSVSTATTPAPAASAAVRART